MTKRQYLQKARALIEQGWCQKRFVHQRAVGTKDLCQAVRKANPDLNAPAFRGSISEWNDAPGRTQAEVLDLLDKTIASLPEGQ